MQAQPNLLRQTTLLQPAPVFTSLISPDQSFDSRKNHAIYLFQTSPAEQFIP
jgi:hypothetical protein